jgi:threonine/homoserine/homoserine lactone efflux protein
MLIAMALVTIGAYRAVNAFRRQPITDISESAKTPSRLWISLKQRFPKLMNRLDPNADLSVSQRITRAALAGFAACGLHPKVFPIAIAAGHQIVQINDPRVRGVGIVIFAAIAVVPAVLPAVIELVRPGAVVRIKQSYESTMKVHGRWITALLLLGAGAFVAHDAWKVMPGH